MDWTTILTGAIFLVVLVTVIGLVKSVLRLIISVAVGAFAAGLTYWVMQILGLTDTVPNTVILIPGALAALSVLIKRR